MEGWLAPYSPDLNPIEKAWSKLKARLRALAARAMPQLELPPHTQSTPLPLKRQQHGSDCDSATTPEGKMVSPTA